LNNKNVKDIETNLATSGQSPITLTEENLADLIVDAIRDIKGQHIIKIDLREIDDSPADYFIICEGESTVKINAISHNIARRVKEEAGMKPGHLEGGPGAKWILVDYFSILVHIFYPETRAFYDLEGLWADGEVTEYSDL